jgi:hypothetical protein
MEMALSRLYWILIGRKDEAEEGERKRGLKGREARA